MVTNMIDIQHHIQLVERKIERIVRRRRKYGKAINTIVFIAGAISIAFLMILGLEITFDQKAIVTLIGLISISTGVGLICIYNSILHIKIRDYQSFISELREIERKIGSTFDPREH